MPDARPYVSGYGNLGAVPADSLFERLLAEAAAAPVQGWDFSWFDGRASEQRPSWGYAELMGRQMTAAGSALDLQTGGGEVLAGIPHSPALLCATESWPPNVRIARANLAPLGGRVVQAEDGQPLPFRSESFDLVVSRHPTVVLWNEIARVLRPRRPVPVPADRHRLQPRAVRVPDGASAASGGRWE